jgi:hypothetical protein
MSRAECPECGERVKVSEDGRKLRCPECGTLFRSPDDDEDDERRPRSRRQAGARKSSGTMIVAVIVGGLLVLALIGLVVVLIVRKGGRDGSPAIDQAKVTVDNFKSVKPGMELSEVEGILGGSRSSSEDDMRDAFRKSFGEIQAAFEAGFSRFGEGTVWRRWEGKNVRVWVAFAKPNDGPPRASFSTAIEQTSGAPKRLDGFVTFAGFTDLDQLGADRKKEDALRKDRKWVRGAQARELLLGEWRDAQFGGYVFGPGGKLSEFDPFAALRQPSSYRIVDDRFLEITTPSPFAPLQGQPPPPNWVDTKPITRRYEYLVNRDELTLIDASPQVVLGVREFYRMPATAGSLAETKLVAPLIADLKGTDAGKRLNALVQLQHLGKSAPTALQPLTQLLYSTDEAVANQAAEVLGALQESAAPAVPALVQLLSDPNAPRALKAARVLGNIGPAAKEALPALRDVVLKSKDFFTRTEAQEAIRKIEGR